MSPLIIRVSCTSWSASPLIWKASPPDAQTQVNLLYAALVACEEQVLRPGIRPAGVVVLQVIAGNGSVARGQIVMDCIGGSARQHMNPASGVSNCRIQLQGILAGAIHHDAVASVSRHYVKRNLVAVAVAVQIKTGLPICSEFIAYNIDLCAAGINVHTYAAVSGKHVLSEGYLGRSPEVQAPVGIRRECQALDQNVAD